jgi:hypothetical protein
LVGYVNCGKWGSTVVRKQTGNGRTIGIEREGGEVGRRRGRQKRKTSELILIEEQNRVKTSK